MKVNLVQTSIAWESPMENRAHIADLINNAPYADIIILPEMFTTGFTLSPADIAEKKGAETLDWISKIAQKHGAAVAGSLAVEDDGKHYNRFYFVRPDGSFTKYDKRHLFTYGGEQNLYSAGQDRVITEYKGVRILLQICYDLRFPVFSRNTGDYDMVIYVANWPQSRIAIWNTLLRARAIENVCYVAGVNRVGSDPNSVYSGESALIDFKGNDIVCAPSMQETVVFGEIDMDELKKFRTKFPALNDADNFKML